MEIFVSDLSLGESCWISWLENSKGHSGGVLEQSICYEHWWDNSWQLLYNKCQAHKKYVEKEE